MQFFVLVGDKQVGPYTAREMQTMLDDGRLSADDLCWHDGLAGWIPIRRVGEVNSSRPSRTLAVAEKAPADLQRVPRLPYYLEDIPKSEKEKGFNPAPAAWVCFLLAIFGLICFSYFWAPVAVVLFFVVFVLAIVALAKGSVTQGVALLLALAVIAPVACIVAPLILPGVLVAAKNTKADDDPQAPVVTSNVPLTPPPPTPTPAAFLIDVKYSQQEAIRKHGDLAVAGSPLNRAFIQRLGEWKANGDPRLSRSNWPEILAEDCATNP